MEQNKTQSEIGRLVEELTAQPILFNPLYKKVTGSFSAAILLSQIMYWRKKMNRPFYKTDEDFAESLCMTSKEFRTAKEHISKVPFVSISRSGVPAKTTYDVNYHVYLSVMKQAVMELDTTCPNGRIAKKGVTLPAQTGIHSSAQMGVTITETTQRLPENTYIDETSSTPKPPRLLYSGDFDKFWVMYVVGSKKNAFEAWKKQKPTPKEQEEILSCIPVYKAYCTENQRSIKDGQGWINGRFWETDWKTQPKNNFNATSVQPFRGF